jgi:hypothetical protein
MRSQVQVDPSQGDHIFGACIPFGGNGYVKIFPREYFPYWIMGEQSARLHQASAIKKGILS